jgi:hypothetical protein
MNALYEKSIGLSIITYSTNHEVAKNFHIYLAIVSRYPLGNFEKYIIYHEPANKKYSLVVNLKDRNICIVGSHLPFNPLAQSYAAKRIKALNDIIDKVNNENNIVFIVGDLNFRNIPNTILKKVVNLVPGFNKGNQLENYIDFSKKKTSKQIIDLSSDLGVTCKMMKTRSEYCGTLPVMQPEVSVDVDAETDISGEEEIELLEKNDYRCVSLTRYPSQCDRLLAILPPIHNFTNIEKYNLSTVPFNYSDHNAILIRFEMYSQQGAGRTRIVLKKSRKIYVVKKEKDTGLKFIIMQREKTYLKELKGKYVYK